MKEKITSLQNFYVIEPVRQNFEYILQRFEKDIIIDSSQSYCKIGLDDKLIHVFNKAIYYGAEEITLGQLSDYTNVGGWSFSERHNHKVVSSVKTMALEEIPVSEIIKIDIEGLEINLLEHSESVRKCKFIFLELHDELKDNAEWLLSNYLPDHRIVFSKEEQYFLELF
jgi:FkbM family methyltransferase